MPKAPPVREQCPTCGQRLPMPKYTCAICGDGAKINPDKLDRDVPGHAWDHKASLA
jgi:rRNA maturation endonuclease Nob1